MKRQPLLTLKPACKDQKSSCKKACTICGSAVPAYGWRALILIILVTVQDRILIQQGESPPALLIQEGIG